MCSNVGKRIRDIREGKGVSQNQLAKMAGLSQAGLSAVENTTKSPNLETLTRLAKALNVTIAYLVGEADKDNDQEVRMIARQIQDLTPHDKELLKGLIESMRKAGKAAQD